MHPSSYIRGGHVDKRIIKKKNKDKYKDEQVLVVPFKETKNIEDKFTKLNHDKDIWSRFDNGKYIYRYDAEEEPSFQQIIPYILIRNPLNNSYYVSKRIAGDDRLNQKLSFWGGHINPCDGTKDVLFKALFRELHEELDIEPIGSAKFHGYVRGLTSPTSDHLGCVFLVETTECAVKETDKAKGLWMTPTQLENDYFEFENWAKHIIDYIVYNNYKL